VNEKSDLREALDGFSFVVHHTHLLAERALSHVAIAAAAMAIALVIAIPLGVWLGHIHRGAFVAINVANVGRALPSLAIIAIAIAFLGLDLKTLLLALVVLAVPPMLTNAWAAVDGVDADLVDAARGMGMSPFEVLRHVEIPMALPLLFAGIRTAAVYVIATVPLGALAGTDGGLGDIIVNQASYHLSGVVGAALCVAALALAVDAGFAGLQRLVTPRGLRTHIDFAAVQTEAAQIEPQPSAVT
jgi:osmoprotectant transport system permease protein